VATNEDLLANFHPMPSPRPLRLGLDALHAPMPILGTQADDARSLRPPILFSTEGGFFDEKLGRFIGPGDLLSSDGRVVATNRQLLAGFHPMPPARDYGLDAAFVFDPAGPIDCDDCLPEVWFSVEHGFFDEALGRFVGDGDVLSSRGKVVATNADLLKPFAPWPRPQGYGLDALFVLRPAASADGASADSAEPVRPLILFSTERGFYSKRLHKWIGAGDLLSSDGRVIATNAELLAAFGPHWPLRAGLDAVTLVPFVGPIVADGDVVATTVPEPATLGLLALGGFCGFVARRH